MTTDPKTETPQRVGPLAPLFGVQDPREPDGFCVWCSAPYYIGDKTYTHPISREVHCSKECSDDHDANL